MGRIKYYIFLVLVFIMCLTVFPAGCINRTHTLPGWQIIRPLDMIMCMAVDGDTIWAGGKNGVYALDRRTGSLIKKLKPNPAFDYVKSLLVDKTGTLYVAHFNGLTTYDGTNFRTYTKKDGLPDNRVNALMQDKEGRLWVGTWVGIGILENGQWRIMTKADGLTEDMVNLMLQDNTGGIWFGAAVAPHGGLSYFKDGRWQYFSTTNGLPHNNINGLIQDSAGIIWAATGYLDRGGVAQFVNTSSGWNIQRILTQHDGLAGAKARSVFQDKDGVIWIGSEYDGMTRYFQGKTTILTMKSGLSNSEVMCIAQDIDGNLWLGTADGITRLSPEALKALF
jgi:ligand-binding sensor domain-containing protein